MMRKILLGCGIASSVLYVGSDILASLRYPGYRYTDFTVSELMAAGAPTRALLVALFIPYNLLAMAFGVGVWQSASSRRAARVSGVLLVAYGLAGMVGLLLFRMNTRAVLAAGGGDLRNAMHPVATVVISLLLLATMVVASKLPGRQFQYYTYGTILVLVVFGVLTSLQTARMAANLPTPGMGLKERVNIYATMLWIAVLAIALLRARRNQTATVPGSPMATTISRATVPSGR